MESACVSCCTQVEAARLRREKRLRLEGPALVLQGTCDALEVMRV